MNSIYYRLSPKVGIEKGPHTSKCTSSKDVIVRLTGTLMNRCLCLAWMQTVYMQSSFVYPSIRVSMVVGFIWASHRCHILDSEIVREFPVDLVLAVIGAFDESIVGSIVGSNIGNLSVSPVSVVGSR